MKKKFIGILLSVVIILSTFSLLLTVTTTAQLPNLIINGGAEGVMVDNGSGGQVLKQKYDATDAANSAYPGEMMNGNVYGFRNCSDRWANISLRKVSDITIVPSGYYHSHSGAYAIGINTNQQLYQDIEIEKNKAYTVSAKITAYANTVAVGGNRFFDMFIDNYAGTITEQFNLPSGKDWNLATGHSEVMNAIKQRFNNPTAVTAASNYKGTGDFEEYSFTFKARDLIEEYGLTVNSNGKYDVRFVIHNRTEYILLADDISIVEADMSQFATAEAGKGGTIVGEAKNDGTASDVTAVPYFGNSFIGWYDEDDALVSTDANFKGVLTKTIIAKFERKNLVDDGDFEVGGAETLEKYNNYPHYTGNAKGTLKLVDTCIKNSGPEYGNKALSLTPNQGTSNDKIKDLLSIPVALEQGKTYIWKFSYAFPSVAYDAGKHYLQFSVDKAVGGDPIGWGGTVEYSFHAQRSSLPALDESSASWGINKPVTANAAARNINASAAGEWVHMYIIFTADATETYHLTLGTPQSCKDTFVIDNVSCSETTQTIAPTKITIDGDGTVSSYQADVSAYRATVNDYNTIFATKEATPYYGQMYVTHYANPARGYKFDGWYENGQKVSSDTSFTAMSVGGEYTAKFISDPDKYIVDAVVETVDGTFGGYITSDASSADYYNGEDITFVAHEYKGNSFVGWYDGSKLLSDKSEYTHTVKKNLTITAKFENNNLFEDPGYENHEPGDNLWGADKEWYTDSATNAMEGVVISTDSYDGENSLCINAPGKRVVSRAFNVPAGTYHFAFDWRTVLSYESGNAALSKVEIVNAADGSVIAESAAAIPGLGDAGWQNYSVNFTANTDLSVKFAITYVADHSAMFLDNLTLYDISKHDFVITTEIATANGIYPGKVVSPSVITAAAGDSVTVEAVGYDRNTFLGWYYGNVKLSSDLSYTFAADSYANLVARFEIENIFPDAGFENTPAGVELSTVENAYFKNNVSWGSISLTETAARSGKYGVDVHHRNNEFNTIITGLKENTDYELSFWWKMAVPSAQVKFDYVEIHGVQTEKMLKNASGSASSDQWQQIKVAFNTGANTEIKVDYLYVSGSSHCYLDDFCLFETNNVQVFAGEGGTYTATHEGSTDKGTSVTVTAVETTGRFLGWYDYINPQIKYSSDLSFTFTVEKSIALIAYFEGEGIAPINYFVDGGFENGNFGGVVFSHPWGSTANCKYSIVSGDTTNGITPRSGNSMLKINNTGNYTIIHLPNLKPSTDYTLTFYWNAPEGTGLATTSIWPYLREMLPLDQNSEGKQKITFQYYNSSNNDVMKMASAYVLGQQHSSGGWQKVQLSFNSDATDENILQMMTYGGHISLYIDDITLNEGNSGYSENIENGDFSTPSAKDAWMGDYTVSGSGASAYGESVATMQQNLILDTAKAYTLRFKAKSTTPSAAQLFYGFTVGGVESLTTQSALSNISHSTVTLGSEWNEYELTFYTTQYTHYSLFFNSLNGQGYAIDDVTICEAEGLAPVETVTFEESEGRDTIIDSLSFSAKNMKNRDWYEYSNSENHTENGGYSLLMKHKSDFVKHSFIQPSTIVEVASGRTYHVSFWAKAKTADTYFRAYGQVHAEGWEIVDVYNEEIKLSDTEWQKFDFYFTVPHIEQWGGPSLMLMVDGIEGKTNCDIYFDDFAIEESERVVLDKKPTLLYTQNLSQNYFYPNYHFENENDPYFGANTVKGSDAFYGDKYLKVNAGDKIIVPVVTRQDWDLALYAEYTLSAAIRGNASAEGYVGLSYTADGSCLVKNKAGVPVTLSVNTEGKWVHDGMSIVENSFTKLYLVVECTAGSFDLDYISMFNTRRAYAENTDDLKDYTFDETNPDNFVDANTVVRENMLIGTLTGLPDGSMVVLSGKNTYSAIVTPTGEYSIRNIADGTYNLFIVPSDWDKATFWGDITFKNGKASGLGITRHSGAVTTVEYDGVKNGLAKITDDETGYSYLTATDADGHFCAYILDSAWSLVGTSTETDILSTYSLTLEKFDNDQLKTATVEDMGIIIDTDEKSAGSFGSVSVMGRERGLIVPAVILIALIASFAAILFIKRKEVNAQ